MAEIVKTEEQLRDEWINRPYELAQMSFAEWKATGAGTRFEVSSSPIETPDPDEPIVGAGRLRHEPGKMNKLEAKYAAHLDLRKMCGEILEWRFEPMKLRLAPKTYFDVDFLVQVMVYDREVNVSAACIELHEVKGHWEDDARVKVKVAAAMYPWWTFRGVQWDKATKDWKFEEFKA